MEFLTIDFETASRYEYSPCSVSIYSFNNGKKEQLLSTLINPGDVYFEPKLVKLHGITQDSVKNAPKIQDVLKDICNIISNKFIFAHNAGFDISQIIHGCNIYDIKIPDFQYADSLMIAKRTWKGLINYKLDTVSEHLNISLNHHNANSDAIACGEIIINAINFYEITSIYDLLAIVKYNYGYYKNENFYSAHSQRIYKHKPSKTDYDRIKDIQITPNINSLLNEKNIVFTGALSITRQEAMKLAASCGAIPAPSVPKSTNYLVVGNDDYGNFKLGNKSNKMIKAEKLIADGQDLEMIDEDTFFELTQNC